MSLHTEEFDAKLSHEVISDANHFYDAIVKHVEQPHNYHNIIMTRQARMIDSQDFEPVHSSYIPQHQLDISNHNRVKYKQSKIYLGHEQRYKINQISYGMVHANYVIDKNNPQDLNLHLLTVSSLHPDSYSKAGPDHHALVMEDIHHEDSRTAFVHEWTHMHQFAVRHMQQYPPVDTHEKYLQQPTEIEAHTNQIMHRISRSVASSPKLLQQIRNAKSNDERLHVVWPHLDTHEQKFIALTHNDNVAIIRQHINKVAGV